jgi:hypothetical protein
MHRSRKIFSLKEAVSGIFMIMTLLWLTVSTPFVFPGKADQKQTSQQKDADQHEEDNPFSRTTEEKPERSSNSLSEYLHELYEVKLPITFITNSYKIHSTTLYLAYHPELVSPPPKA